MYVKNVYQSLSDCVAELLHSSTGQNTAVFEVITVSLFSPAYLALLNNYIITMMHDGDGISYFLYACRNCMFYTHAGL